MKIVLIEGIADGCGKTTTIKAIKEKLESKGLRVLVTNDFDSQSGQGLLEEIRYSSTDTSDLHTRILEERKATYQRIIDVQDDYDFAILDRGFISTLAEQALIPIAGNKGDLTPEQESLGAEIIAGNYEALRMLAGHTFICYFLVASVAVVRSRREGRGEDDARAERTPLEVQMASYLTAAKTWNEMDGITVNNIAIEGELNIDDIVS